MPKLILKALPSGVSLKDIPAGYIFEDREGDVSLRTDQGAVWLPHGTHYPLDQRPVNPWKVHLAVVIAMLMGIWFGCQQLVPVTKTPTPDLSRRSRRSSRAAAIEATNKYQPYPKWLRFNDVNRIVKMTLAFSDDNPVFSCLREIA